MTSPDLDVGNGTDRPTHLLGFVGNAAPSRMPMWVGPIVGDAKGRAWTDVGQGRLAPASDEPWVPTQVLTRLHEPLPIEWLPGRSCLLLGPQETRWLPSQLETGRLGELYAFAHGSRASAPELGATRIQGTFVLWYCSADEAASVRDRLSRDAWEAVLDYARRADLSQHEAQARLADLAFHLQRCALQRIEWAKALAALELAGETSFAGRMRATLSRELGEAATAEAERAASEALRAAKASEPAEAPRRAAREPREAGSASRLPAEARAVRIEQTYRPREAAP